MAVLLIGSNLVVLGASEQMHNLLNMSTKKFEGFFDMAAGAKLSLNLKRQLKSKQTFIKIDVWHEQRNTLNARLAVSDRKAEGWFPLGVDSRRSLKNSLFFDLVLCAERTRCPQGGHSVTLPTTRS